MKKKRNLLKRRRMDKLRRILKPIRVFSGRKRFKRKDLDLVSWIRVQSESLGFSTNEFTDLVSKQDIYKNKVIDESIAPCLMNGRIVAKRFRTLEYDKELKFDVDLKLPFFYEEEDPIYNAVEEVCSIKKTSKQKFLMEVYYRFLRMNGYKVDENGDLFDICDDQSYLNMVTDMHFRKEWKPYNWSFPLDYGADYDWKYLHKESDKVKRMRSINNKKVTVKIPKSNMVYSSNAIDLTIVHLSFIFHRSYSYLFKMLLLMFFREIKIVDEYTFELKANYIDLIKTANLSDLEHLNL